MQTRFPGSNDYTADVARPMDSYLASFAYVSVPDRLSLVRNTLVVVYKEHWTFRRYFNSSLRRQKTLAQFIGRRTKGGPVLQVEHEKGQKCYRLRGWWYESWHHNCQQNLPGWRDQSPSLGEVPSHRDTKGSVYRNYFIPKRGEQKNEFLIPS